MFVELWPVVWIGGDLRSGTPPSSEVRGNALQPGATPIPRPSKLSARPQCVGDADRGGPGARKKSWHGWMAMHCIWTSTAE